MFRIGMLLFLATLLSAAGCRTEYRGSNSILEVGDEARDQTVTYFPTAGASARSDLKSGP
jgi:hypothetical protein